MSWLWGNTTAEQAQVVVSSLQEELDDRQLRIDHLKVVLKETQDTHEQYLREEIEELQVRRSILLKELDSINSLINQKRNSLNGELRKTVHINNQYQRELRNCVANTSERHLTSIKAAGVASSPGEIAAAADASSGDIEETNTNNNTTSSLEASSLEASSLEASVLKTSSLEASALKTSASQSSSTGILPCDLTRNTDKELLNVREIAKDAAFIVQRSTNSNTVVYSGVVTLNGTLNPQNPIDVYWIMYEKSGHPREELNVIERNSAYGASFAPHPSGTPGHFQITLASLKDREITLFQDFQGGIAATTTINHRSDMLLQRVYVNSTTKWGIPYVSYIEIFGLDPQTGESVYEKKMN